MPDKGLVFVAWQKGDIFTEFDTCEKHYGNEISLTFMFNNWFNKNLT